MVLPPSFSRKMGEIETVEAEKMGWIYLPRGTFYPTLPYQPAFPPADHPDRAKSGVIQVLKQFRPFTPRRTLPRVPSSDGGERGCRAHKQK